MRHKQWVGRLIAAMVLCALLQADAAQAATQYFSNTGGAQTWGSASNWSSSTGVSGGPYNSAWVAYNNAVFEGASGTVNVSGTQDENVLTFNVNGYVLNGGTLQIGNPTIPGFYVISGATATINSALGQSGAGNTVVIGQTGDAGTLILAGSASTLTRAISLNAGVLSFANGSLGSGSLTMNGGGLQWYGGNTQDISGQLLMVNSTTATFDTNGNNINLGAVFGGATSGALSKIGAGMLTLNAAETYTGSTIVSNGTLALGSAGSVINGSSLIVAAGALVNASSGANNSLPRGTGVAWTVAGTVNQPGSMAQTFPLGGITLNGGTLTSPTSSGNAANGNFYVGASDILSANGSGNTINCTNFGLATGFTLTLNTPNVTDSLAASTQFILAGGLIKSGNGTVILSGSNSYTGVTTINAGTLSLANSAALAGGGNVTFGGGVLQYSASNTQDYSSKFVSSTAAMAIDVNGQSVTYAGTIAATNTAGLTVESSAGGGTLTLTNSNNFSGTTLAGGGLLLLANSAALQSSTFDASGSGTVSFGTLNSATFGGLQGASGTLMLNNTTPVGVALSVGNNGASTTYSGILAGSGSLTKIGAGSLTMTGSNNYSGGTTIGGGLLSFSNLSAIPTTGQIAINSPGALAATIYGTSPVTNWLGSGLIASNPTGGIALTNGVLDTEAIALSSTSSQLSLGAVLGGSATYSGVLTTPATTYYLGGGGGTLTFTPTLSGSNGLVVGNGGAGTLILTGSNSYTGLTSVSAGTVTVTGNNSAATGGWRILNGNNTSTQTVNFNSGSSIAIAGSNTFQLGNTTGSGAAATLNVAGIVSNSGALNIQRAAVFNINSGGAWTQNGSMQLAAPAGGVSSSMTVASGGSFTYSNTATSPIQVSPGVNAAGSATLIIDGSFTTNQGFVNTVAGTGSGSANINLVGGALFLTANIPALTSTAGSPFNFTLGTGGGTINTGGFATTMSNAITGTGGLTLAGGGMLSLGGSSIYSGATTVSAGTLMINPATVVSNVGLAAASVAGGAALNLNWGTNSSDSWQLKSAITGAGTIVSSGNGWIDTNGAGVFTNFAGNIIVNGGVFGNGNANGTWTNSTANLTVNSPGVFDLRGNPNATIVSTLSGSGDVVNTYSGNVANLQIGVGNASSTYYGIIHGNATGTSIGTSGVAYSSANAEGGTTTLTKIGTGSLTLLGLNTYSGATLISAGTLALAGNGSINSSAISIASGAVFNVSGLASTFPLGASQTLTGGRTSSPAVDVLGNIASNGSIAISAGTMTIAGNVALNGPDTLLEALGGTQSLLAISGGSLALTGTTTVQPSILYNGSYTLVNGYSSVTGGTGNLALTTSAFRGSPTYAFTVGTSAITATVSGLAPASSLVWTGTGGNNNWDVVTTSNWSNNGVADKYYQNDAVVFNDTAGTKSVTVPAIVYPGSVSVTTTGTYTIGGPGGISGNGGLTKSGTGTLILAASDTYTGGTLVSGGTLQLGNGTANLGYVSGGIVLANSSTLAISNYTAQTFAQPISGAGSFVKSGAGVLTLGGTNSYSGPTFINAGELTFASTTASPGAITFGGGSLQYTSSNTQDYSSAIVNSPAASPISIDTNGQSVTFASPLSSSNSSGLTKIGAGTLTLSAANNYLGTTNLTAGTLATAVNGALPATTTLNFSGNTTLNIGGTSQTVNGLTYQASVGVTNSIVGSGGTLNFNGGGAESIGNTTNNGNNGYTQSLTLSGLTANFTTGSPTLYIGYCYGGNSGATGTGILTLGTGTLNASTIILAYSQYNGTGAIAPAAVGTLTVNAGGLLKVSTLEMGDATNDSYATPVLNLNGGGTLLVQSITKGSVQSGKAYTPVINFNTGTIENYNSSTALSITSAASIVLASTGTQTFDITSGETGTISAAISGAGALNKIDSGTLVLAATNTYGGTTNLVGGIVNLGIAETVGTSGPLGKSVAANPGSIILSGGTLQYSSVNANDYSGRFSTAANQQYNVDTNGQSVTWATPLVSASGSLTKVNSGTLTLTAPNTYTGLTTISAGTLALTGNGTIGGGGLTITPSAVFNVSAIGGGYNFGSGTLIAGRFSSPTADVLGSLNVQNAGIGFAGTSGTMTISGGLSLASGALGYYQNDLVNAVGGLAFSGTDYVALSGPVVGSSAGTTYTLFTGNVSPSATSAFYTGATANIEGLTNPRQAYAINTSGGTAVTLTVTGVAGSLQWVGGSNSSWDNGASQSWINTVSNSPDYFFAGDNVTFSDSGRAAPVVTINGAISPGSIIVSNTAANYTFTGTGSIVGGTSLVMNGPGSLTINNSNTYTGGTTITGGALNANAAQALGSGPLTIGGGTLNVYAAQSLSGGTVNSGLLYLGGSLTLGSALNVAGGQIAASSGTAALASSLVYTSPAASTFAGSITGGVNSVILNNAAAVLNLAGSSTYAGGTTITAGLLQLGSVSGLGATTGNLTITAGTLDLNGYSTTVGALSGGSASIITGVSGSGALTTNTTSSATFAGTIGNSAYPINLAKAGAGTLTLTGSSNYTGTTSLTAGVLQVGNGGTSGAIGPGPVAITSGAIFEMNLSNSQTFSNTLSGAGEFYKQNSNALTYTGTSTAFTGSIQLASGSTFTLSPSGRITGLGSASSDQYINATWNFNGPVSMTTFNGSTTGGGSSNGSPTVNVNINNTFSATTLNGAYVGNNSSTSTTNVNINAGSTATIGTMQLSQAGYCDYSTAKSTVNIYGVLTVTNLDGWASSSSGASGTLDRYINVFSGGQLNATTINLSQTGQTGTYNRLLTLGGGTLAAIAGANMTSDSTTTVTLTGGTSTLSVASPYSMTINGAIGGTGGLATVGNGTYILPVANSYSGGTVISAGTLQLGNYSALGNSSGALTVNAGALNMAGFNPSVASLSGSMGVVTNSNSAALATLDLVGGAATTFSGSFKDGAGQVGLQIDSGSTLTLAGSNTHSGPTTIDSGSLIAAGPNVLSASSALNNNYGTLDVTAGSQSVASLAIGYGATLNLSIGKVLTSLGAVNFYGTLNVTGAAGSSNKLIAYPNVVYNGGDGAFNAVDLNGVPLSSTSYTLAYNANELDLTLTSPPANWIASGGGSWTTSGNWSSNSVPNGQGVTAILGSATLTPAAITLDGAQTLGSLVFNNSNAYTLTPGSGGSLTMDNTGGGDDASIVVLGGSHTIAAPLTLAGTNTAIAAVSGGALGITGNILDGSGGASALTFSSSDGTGLLTLSGSNNFGGGANVKSGTLILDGAASLLAGSSLTIGSGAGPGAVFAPPAASLAASPNLAPVPEPGTLALFAVCAVAIGLRLRRRKA